MIPALGRWLTSDRVEILIWGKVPTGERLWQALSAGGFEYQYDDEGREYRERTGELLVRLGAGLDAPRWFRNRVACSGNRRLERRRALCLDFE